LKKPKSDGEYKGSVRLTIDPTKKL